MRRPCGSPPSNQPQDYPKGWDEAGRLLLNRGDVLVRAHLLHEDLGGPGVAKNLVVTCKGVNSKLYTELEKTVLDWVAQGTTVDFEVKVQYSGDSPYPKSFTVHASRLDCQSSTKEKAVCNEINPPGGIQAVVNLTSCPGAIKK
jgi:hypothetical protein